MANLPSVVEKTLLEHLNDLKFLVLKAAGIISLSIIGSLFFRSDIYATLQAPLGTRRLYFHSPTDSVDFLVRSHLLISLLVSLPFLLFIAWKYLKSIILNQKIERYITFLLMLATFLFYLGIGYGYQFLVPESLNFLFSLAPANTDFIMNATDYIGFLTGLCVVCGLLFLFPIVLHSAIISGLIKMNWLRQNTKMIYAILIVATCLLMPIPDFLSLGLILTAILVLYEATLFVTKIVTTD